MMNLAGPSTFQTLLLFFTNVILNKPLCCTTHDFHKHCVVLGAALES